MLPFKVTRKAQEDLIATGRFTQREWGVRKRNHYLRQLDRCFARLASNPGLGARCDFIADGYRKFPHASHVIYYRLGPGERVESIRILHKSMDVESKF